jgi:hypothetical protein
VQLDQIVPNRAIGYRGSVVAPNVVEPSYVRELPERELAEWRVDNECGTATLIKPETKLGNLAIPLAPMLGCFGVAPPGGQAISTATSAEHGGQYGLPRVIVIGNLSTLWTFPWAMMAQTVAVRGSRCWSPQAGVAPFACVRPLPFDAPD